MATGKIQDCDSCGLKCQMYRLGVEVIEARKDPDKFWSYSPATPTEELRKRYGINE